MSTALIVEDDPDQAEMAARLLKYRGFESQIAPTGGEGLAKARSIRPDVVLLDLMLPDTTGFDVCRELRADRRTMLTPVVMLTALGDELNRAKGFRVDWKAIAEQSQEACDRLNVVPPLPAAQFGHLSGGNQQKALLGKWMFTEPDILIMDEPTRGIDVGAKYDIYCLINDMVSKGKSVVMISSELPELLGMCDRIYVMNEGRLLAEVNAADATQESIMGYIIRDTAKA